MGKEKDYIKAVPEFRKQFNQFCLEYNLDTFQAIRILSKNIEEMAHQARDIKILFDED